MTSHIKPEKQTATVIAPKDDWGADADDWGADTSDFNDTALAVHADKRKSHSEADDVDDLAALLEKHAIASSTLTAESAYHAHGSKKQKKKEKKMADAVVNEGVPVREGGLQPHFINVIEVCGENEILQ